LRYAVDVLDDLYVLRDRARSAAARGDHETALTALLAAASQTHVDEHDYVAVLKPLEEVLGQRGDARGALTVLGYEASSEPAAWRRAADLMGKVPPVDRARVLAAQGHMPEAAREMEDAGLVAAAAILRERSKDWTAARALWSRLAHVTEHGDDAYVSALVRFNLARCARQCGDAGQAREAVVASVRLLEEAADHFESIGQRERAFDCFQVLSQVGRESGAFEDVLEGYVNCIRILREDHLKGFALEYFDEAIAAAAEKGETAAAATLAREASEYARTLGQAASAGNYAIRQAGLWRAVARQHLDRGAPPEIAENALLASILAFGEVGQYARVGELYRELSSLELERYRREHYARVARRYQGVADEPLDGARNGGAPLRQDSHVTEVWHVDVVEWEQRGSAAEACADVLLDKRWPDLIRRKAMLARLTALSLEANPTDDGAPATAARVRLAEQLAQLQLYAVLSPLEKLLERPERRVRVAVLQAMQTLFFKRSFVAVRRGLADPDAAVVDQAAKAVEALSFQHAVDPLTRIAREAPQPEVRAAAMHAIARIDSNEAAEFLIGVLEHGAAADRLAALVALKGARGVRFVELARSTMANAPPALAATLREALSARGL
jgi:tetratricopeptide (TPR) repeat protein